MLVFTLRRIWARSQPRCSENVPMSSQGAAKEANLGAKSINMSQLGRQDDQLRANLGPFFDHFWVQERLRNKVEIKSLLEPPSRGKNLQKPKQNDHFYKPVLANEREARFLFLKSTRPKGANRSEWEPIGANRRQQEQEEPLGANRRQ